MSRITSEQLDNAIAEHQELKISRAYTLCPAHIECGYSIYYFTDIYRVDKWVVLEGYHPHPEIGPFGAPRLHPDSKIKVLVRYGRSHKELYNYQIDSVLLHKEDLASIKVWLSKKEE